MTTVECEIVLLTSKGKQGFIIQSVGRHAVARCFRYIFGLPFHQASELVQTLLSVFWLIGYIFLDSHSIIKVWMQSIDLDQ